jgi:hypothetical protein
LGAVSDRAPVGKVPEDYGEDGIAGMSDDHQRLCFALAL